MTKVNTWQTSEENTLPESHKSSMLSNVFVKNCIYKFYFYSILYTYMFYLHLVEDLFMNLRREVTLIIMQCNKAVSHSFSFKGEMERKMKH